jgi:hypothetical protein
MLVPETMQAYSDLKADDLGNLWVQEFDPDADGSRSWSVFDSDGRMLGSVLLPVDSRPTHIGEDFLLGIWRDDLEGERVQMYGLMKE